MRLKVFRERHGAVNYWTYELRQHGVIKVTGCRRSWPEALRAGLGWLGRPDP